VGRESATDDIFREYMGQNPNAFMKLLSANAPGFLADKQKNSYRWIRNLAQTIATSGPEVYANAEKDPFVMKPTISAADIGKLLMWNYKAKWDKELPYWDAFPVDFIVDVKDDHFYGLNLHYLHPKRRAQLMDALMTLANNDRMDKKTKLMLSYRILKATGSLSAYQPCFKKYLKSHVQSRFLYVNPSNWNIALFLPLASWQKASEATVWSDSEKMIQKARNKKL
jgi:hypothetical protein